MKIKILITASELPNDYLKYDVVVLPSKDIVLHSGKATKYIADVITNTKLYCHKCFKVFQNQEEAKNHKCGC